MTPAFCRLSATVTSLALLLAPVAATAEGSVASPGGNASAALDFRIIIPPIMRVLENSHPQQLAADADGTLGAEQRLVVLSNMKRGFCVQLRLGNTGLEGWQLEATPEPGLTQQTSADGYRFCSARPGRYTLVLQHRFTADNATPSAQLHWPVQTDIVTL